MAAVSAVDWPQQRNIPVSGMVVDAQVLSQLTPPNPPRRVNELKGVETDLESTEAGAPDLENTEAGAPDLENTEAGAPHTGHNPLSMEF